MTHANPFRTALKLIGILGLVVGAVLLLIGAAAYSTALTELEQFGSPLDPARWAGLVSAGSWLGGIGVAALLLWLAVSSIGWDSTIERPDRGQALTPEEISALLQRKADRG